MNLINRIVVVFILLLVVVSSLALLFTFLLFPVEAIANLRDSLDALAESITLGSRLLMALLAALAAIVGFLLLLLEVVPRTRKGVKLTGVSGAAAELTVEAIVNRIRYEVEEVPSVRQAKPKVVSRGKEIDVNLDLYADPTADIASTTEEVSQLVRDVVENKMGVRLRRLKVLVKHDARGKDSKGRGTDQPTSPHQSESPLDVG